MDTQMEAFVLDLLGKLKSEMIVIMVTHKYQIVSKADKQIVFT
jgi:ABC-type lipoprotein export system ATPase subunit